MDRKFNRAGSHHGYHAEFHVHVNRLADFPWDPTPPELPSGRISCPGLLLDHVRIPSPELGSNWPWLNLGNGFSSYYRWVEWYEYTGTFGGTLWVLVVNILIYNLFNIPDSKSGYPGNRLFNFLIPNPRPLITISLFILLPIFFSYFLYFSYHEKPNPVKVVIIQPNIDPFSEQYANTSSPCVGRIMSLAGPVLDSSTNLLVTPESALQEEMWENNMETFESVELVRQVIAKFPDLNIIVGGSTYYAFRPGEKVPHTARKFTRETAGTTGTTHLLW